MVHLAFVLIPLIISFTDHVAGFIRNNKLSTTPRKVPSTKIIGGTPVALGELPYQAQLVRNGDHICSGAIVAPLFVVTFSGCLRFELESYIVRAGHISNTNPEESVQNRNASKFILTNEVMIDDVALVKLSEPFQFNDFVKSIAIPSQGCTLGTSVNDPLLFSGWGSTTVCSNPPLPPPSPILLKKTLKVVSQAKCKDAWDNFDPNFVEPRMMCAGTGQDGSIDDSGNPLTTTKTPKTLIGINYIGNPFCDSEHEIPDLFFRIKDVSDWIKMQVEMP